MLRTRWDRLILGLAFLTPLVGASATAAPNPLMLVETLSDPHHHYAAIAPDPGLSATDACAAQSCLGFVWSEEAEGSKPLWEVWDPADPDAGRLYVADEAFLNLLIGGEMVTSAAPLGWVYGAPALNTTPLFGLLDSANLDAIYTTDPGLAAAPPSGYDPLAVGAHVLAPDQEPVYLAKPQALMLVETLSDPNHHYGPAVPDPNLPATDACAAESCLGFLWGSPVPGAKPLWEVSDPNPTLQGRLYVQDEDFYAFLIGQNFVASSEPVGYVYDFPAPRTTPLYRLLDSVNLDAIYTTDPVLAAQPPEGYDVGVVEAYVLKPDLEPLYFEIAEPLSGDPLGTVLVIHGGGWQSEGAPSISESLSTRPAIARWYRRGWRTVAITYRSSREGESPPPPPFWSGPWQRVEGSASFSIDDAVSFYDGLRSWLGPAEAICADGQSAGGHLSLLIATRRADVDCVVAEAGPSSLPDLSDPLGLSFAEAAFDQYLDEGDFNAVVYDETMSPVLSGQGIDPGTRVLLGTVENDDFVPASQMGLLQTARSNAPPEYTVAKTLAAGSEVWFVHASTTPSAYAEFVALEDDLADAIVPPPPPPPPPSCGLGFEVLAVLLPWAGLRKAKRLRS